MLRYVKFDIKIKFNVEREDVAIRFHLVVFGPVFLCHASVPILKPRPQVSVPIPLIQSRSKDSD